MLLFILATYLKIPGFTNVVDTLFVAIMVFIILVAVVFIAMAYAGAVRKVESKPKEFPRWFEWTVRTAYLGFFAWSGWFVFVGLYTCSIGLLVITEEIISNSDA